MLVQVCTRTSHYPSTRWWFRSREHPEISIPVHNIPHYNGQ